VLLSQRLRLLRVLLFNLLLPRAVRRLLGEALVLLILLLLQALTLCVLLRVQLLLLLQVFALQRRIGPAR
jgi:hypothetical protein